MRKYVALLRGINVSGQKKIRMSELREILTASGLKDVTTYIQSGNVLFAQNGMNPNEAAQRLQSIIEKHYGYHVDVLVILPEELAALPSANPFLNGRSEDISRLYVTFLFASPDPDRLAKLDPNAYPPEEFAVEGAVLYFYSPNGYGKAKMNNNFFERKLKTLATTRNWKTVLRLIELTSPGI